MPKITQLNNKNKYCRVCDTLLVISNNWGPSNSKQYNYICYYCQNKENKNRKAAKRKPKPTEKYCIDCTVELTLTNWATYSKEKRFYICDECYRERRKNYYESNKDELLAQHKEYREVNKEQLKEYLKIIILKIETES